MLSPLLRRRATHAAAILLAATLGSTLAGCGGHDSGTTPTPSPTPTVTGATAPVYVALGDSYTAAPFVPVTDPKLGCLRSTGNYPNLVAQQLPSFQLVDVSCSGASSTSMIGVQLIGNQANAPQFNALNDSTTLVTLGLGGNDLGLFSTLMGTCTSMADQPGPAPCTAYFTRGGHDVLRNKLVNILLRLTAVVKGIRDRAPHARIIVVDYPQLVPAKGTCAALPVKAGDYPYVHGIIEKLAKTARVAATRAQVGATPIDVYDASAGHDICSKDPWIDGKNTDPHRALAFHPFAEEQQAVARLVLAQIKTG